MAGLEVDAGSDAGIFISPQKKGEMGQPRGNPLLGQFK